jgi:glycosyltransferase domain-containing protein
MSLSADPSIRGHRKETGPLTVLLPTHNRPRHCAALLDFYKSCSMHHDIVVADSSNSIESEAVRAACNGIARHCRLEMDVVDKLVTVIQCIETPYVVMTPDDDITFPHAINLALEYLEQNQDYAAAHGYTLRFGQQLENFDIYGIYTFAPSIDRDDPLERHYDLMRRYQPFFWAVFRRDVLLSALEACRTVRSKILFQELTAMNFAVLQGKIAMLPIVYAMRGMERSNAALSSTHPLFACIDDAESFFVNYLAYRNALAQAIRERNIIPNTRSYINPVSGSPDARLEQLIDIVHATWLAREADSGVFNHAAEILLGKSKPLIVGDPVWPGWRPLGEGDLVHGGPTNRRYIWRRALLEAEPRSEIVISYLEMARVERQLDSYRLDTSAI